MNLYFEIFIDKFIFSLFSIGSLLFEFSKIYKTHPTKSSPTRISRILNSHLIQTESTSFRSNFATPGSPNYDNHSIIESHSTLQKRKKKLFLFLEKSKGGKVGSERLIHRLSITFRRLIGKNRTDGSGKENWKRRTRQRRPSGTPVAP